MQSAWHFLVVFLGGGIGSALRYGAGRAAIAIVGPGFPAGTLFVNVFGCFLLGALADWLAFRDPGIGLSFKLFLTTGVLGGFTTFSAFALDVASIWERGDFLTASLYVMGSVVLSIAGLFAGMALMRVVAS